MPDLDYAFLADYAAVQGGKLTAVGASYTWLIVPSFPRPHNLTVAGRIRANEDTAVVPISFSVRPPGGQYDLKVGAELSRDPSAIAYDGKVGFLFAATIGIELPTAGLYEVRVFIEQVEARRLAFEVAASAHVVP